MSIERSTTTPVPAPGNERIRIVIADDHPIFRKGLKSLLEAEAGAECGFEVIGEAGDGTEAVRTVRALHPDVLLLDLAMPASSGMEALGELAAEPSGVRIVLLTAAIERAEVVRALELGALGVVLKNSPPELLFKAIRSVMTGQHWIGRESIGDILDALRRYRQAAPPRPKFGLTPRELEITSAVVLGCSNREIAKQFVLSEDTVKHHLTNIYAKVGASNRLELALFAVHHRLLEPDAS
jgi:DNA-binding NarL/FixJ family response regulator